jgi:superoxide dismutase
MAGLVDETMIPILGLDVWEHACECEIIYSQFTLLVRGNEKGILELVIEHFFLFDL